MDTQQDAEPDGTNNNSQMKVEPQGDGGDDEGVWSADIELAFQESLQIYPPCGRRKIILSEEGKMYGRNEMIARYILLKTGKKRTRKQVSSHIQVLARRQQREKQTVTKTSSLGQSSLSSHPEPSKLLNTVPPHLYTLVDRNHRQEIVSTSLIGSERFGLLEFDVSVLEMSFDNTDERPQQTTRHSFLSIHPSQRNHSEEECVSISEICDKFEDKSDLDDSGIRQLFESGPKDSFFLIKFWADSDFMPNEALEKRFELSSIFESSMKRQIEITTVVYSFSKQAVKKIESATPQQVAPSKVLYRMNSSLCDYGKGFIEKLLLLSPDKAKMDLVLENFNVLYKVKDELTGELLLVLALVFEVSKNASGSSYNIYKLRL